MKALAFIWGLLACMAITPTISAQVIQDDIILALNSGGNSGTVGTYTVLATTTRTLTQVEQANGRLDLVVPSTSHDIYLGLLSPSGDFIWMGAVTTSVVAVAIDPTSSGTYTYVFLEPETKVVYYGTVMTP